VLIAEAHSPFAVLYVRVDVKGIALTELPSRSHELERCHLLDEGVVRHHEDEVGTEDPLTDGEVGRGEQDAIFGVDVTDGKDFVDLKQVVDGRERALVARAGHCGLVILPEFRVDLGSIAVESHNAVDHLRHSPFDRHGPLARRYVCTPEDATEF
jgi:hypothetical protein